MPSAGASFAAGPAGGPNVTVGITGDVTNTAQITDAIYDAFVRALKDVFTAPMWAKGARVMGAKMAKELEKSFTKVAPTISKSLNDAITKGMKSAASSVGKVRTSMGNMVPHTVSAAIDRLIAQFDRLEKAAVLSPKPNVAMERILERLNRQATVATTEGARQQTAALNSALQNQAAATNAAAKKRVVATQAMVGQIRALERGLAATIKFSLDLAGKAAAALGRALRAIGAGAQAGARASAAAMRGLVNAIQTVTRGVARLSAGLATGFARGFAGVSRALASALRRDENALRSSLSRRERAVRASASRQGAAMGGAFGRLGTLIPGLAGGAGIASILTSGFERFGQIETLQFRLERMLGSAEAAKAMIADVSDFARTTSFDLPGVANLATNFLTMGQSASESMVSIRRLADVTAFAGGNTESLERIQRALGQIISTGRLQGDELNQLAENLPGINIRQIIADQLGISTAELVKMQEAGELNADAFITAFLEGIDDPRFAGAATALGQTLTGRLANLKESFAIFGESLVGLVAGPLTDVFNKITDILTLAGGFVSGEMFKVTGPEDNPFQKFAGMAIEDVSTHIPFEELPQEIQDILQERNGWGPGEGYVLAGEHARQFWEELHPPEELSGSMQRLKEFRDIFGDFAKGAGGFLAFVGGLKLFGLALRFLTRPLTIVTGLFGALNAVWGKMMDASPDLRQAMRYLLYRVTPLAKAFGTLFNTVTSLVLNKIFGGEGSLFKRMGDNLAPLIRRMGTLMRLFQEWLTWADTMIKEGKFRKVIDSASQNIQGFLASILGLTDAQQEAAQGLGGNDFGNIFTAFLDKLEDVPILGPIVRFVRRVVDTISDVVRSFAGFVGDIWNDIFGGGDETTGDSQLESIATSMFGSPTEQESVGTRILDTLENTFLGPVVRFFRGPFADGLESAIAAVVGFFQGGGISRMLTNVRTFFAPAIETIGNVIESVWNRVEPIVQPLIDAVTNIVDAFKNMDFSDLDIGSLLAGAGVGAGIGAIFGGPVGAIVGGVAGALFDPLLDVLGNVWTMEIEPALEGVWNSIKAWFLSTFTVGNLFDAAKAGLIGVEGLGEEIGAIIGDPLFAGVVAGMGVGILAAIASVLVFFTVGLAAGIAENAGDWGALIGTGLEMAFNLIPGIDVDLSDLGDMLTGVFENNVGQLSMVLAIAGAIAPVILGGIAQGVKNASTTKGGIATRTAAGFIGIAGGLLAEMTRSITTVFKNQSVLGLMFKGFGKTTPADDATLTTTGKKATQSLANKMYQAVLNPSSSFRNTLRAIGPGVAAIIAGGITGLAVGKALGGESLLEQILGIGGLAAGMAFISLPAGIAAGALGLLGLAMGNAEKKAEASAARVRELADAIRGIGDVPIDVALYEDVFAEITDDEGALTGLGQKLTDAGFDVATFVGQVINGVGQVDSAFYSLLTSVPVTLDQVMGEVSRADLTQALADAVDENDLRSFNDLVANMTQNLVEMGVDAPTAQRAVNEFFDQMAADGLNAEDVWNLVSGAVEDYGKAQDLAAEQSEAAALSIDTVEEAVSALQDALVAGKTGEEIAELLDSKATLSTPDQLKAIETAANDVETAIRDAIDATTELITTKLAPPTLEVTHAEVIIDVQQFNEQVKRAYEDEIVTDFEAAEITVGAQSVKENISGQVSAAVEAGLITSPADLTDFINNMKADPALLNLEPEAQKVVDEMILGLEAVAADPNFGAALAALVSNTAVSTELATAAQLLGEEVPNEVAAGMIGNRAVIDQAMLDLFGGGQGQFVMPGVMTGGGVAPGVAAGEQVATDVAAGMTANSGVIDTATLELLSTAGTTLSAGGPELQTTAKFIVAGVNREFAKMVASAGLYGIAAGRDMAKNFGTHGGGAVRAAQLIGAGVVKALRDMASGASSLGSAAGTGFAKGFGSAAGSAVRAAQLVTAGMRDALDESMYSIGVQAGFSFALGVRSQASAAANAARAIALGAAAAVRAALRIGSPSKVFVDIGRQIGEGFIEGIEDSEGDMTAALETAITNAVTTATDAAGDQVRKAKVGQAIFDALQTTMMPGGASVAADSLAMITRQQAGPTLARGVRGGASSRFLASGTAELHRAAIDINQVFLEFTEAFESLSKQNLDAWTAKGAGEVLTAQQRSLVSGTILTMSAGTFAGATNQRNILDALSTIKAFGAEMLETGHSAQHVASTMAQYRDLLRGQAVAVGLAGADFDKLATAMGLAGTQLNAMVVELTDLRWWTEAGGENARMILEEAQAIRDYASELLASGYSTDLVVARVNQFRDSLVQWAVALGFQKTQVDALIDQVGISATTVAEFTKQMKAFQDAAAGAAQPPAAGEDVAGPRIGELHIHIPSGDPEAVALVAANRLAYQNLTSW